MDQEQGQRRADQIRAFREEMDRLAAEKVLVLPEEERRRLALHHDQILSDLARRFDVDISDAQKQMSLGMRIVSFLGALALAAAVFFLFYQFWGFLSTPVQVLLLVAAPVSAAFATGLAARREKTLYVAALLALVAFACFVLNLVVLGALFNITPSQNAFLVWSAFAALLAYTYSLRVLLTASILCFMGYLSATVGVWGGCYWLDFGYRPENFVLSGAVIFAIPAVFPHRRIPGFPPVYRLFGLLGVLTPILVLANWGDTSYLRLSSGVIEDLYQVLGFLLAAGAIWLGIRRRWGGVTNAGSTFFVVFLYTKLYQWWWDWMPKYLFFLILGAIAIGFLLVLKRLRERTQEAA